MAKILGPPAPAIAGIKASDGGLARIPFSGNHAKQCSVLGRKCGNSFTGQRQGAVGRAIVHDKEFDVPAVALPCQAEDSVGDGGSFVVAGHQHGVAGRFYEFDARGSSISTWNWWMSGERGDVA